MAKRKRHRRRRRVSGPTYAAVGKHRRRRTRKRRMHGPTYAAVGKHRRRRRMGDSGAYMTSIKDFAMILLGGGIAKTGSDMLNPMLYGLAKGPLVPSIIKGFVGSLLFYQGKKGGSPFILGAGIGTAVSGLEDAGRALQMPWMPVLPIIKTDKGTYMYIDTAAYMKGPEKDLFVVIPDKQVAGERDTPVITAPASDAPVISADAPVITGENDYGGTIGGY